MAGSPCILTLIPVINSLARVGLIEGENLSQVIYYSFSFFFSKSLWSVFVSTYLHVIGHFHYGVI